MAIIKCKECDKDVSDSAFKCPSCGVQLKKPKRGFLGKFFKWLLILFNILMVIWLFSVLGATGDAINSAVTEAEKTGTAIGATIGTGILLSIWVMGDIILGLFVLLTRPKY